MMNICKFLSDLIKSRKGRNKIALLSRKSILILLTIVFGFGNLFAQHLFYVSYNDLSQENARHIKTQVDASITSLTRNTKGEYTISLSTVQNSKIIILNEETGKNVVIIPTEEATAQFVLPQFFIEELRQAVLGDAPVERNLQFRSKHQTI